MDLEYDETLGMVTMDTRTFMTLFQAAQPSFKMAAEQLNEGRGTNSARALVFMQSRTADPEGTTEESDWTQGANDFREKTLQMMALAAQDLGVVDATFLATSLVYRQEIVKEIGDPHGT